MESQQEEPLNKLEQKIFDAMMQKDTYEDYARISASIALELAEKAHRRGYQLYQDNDDGGEVEKGFEDFKKEIL